MTTVTEIFYVNVAELMGNIIPKAKLKSKFVYDDIDGFVRIIGWDTLEESRS